MEIEEYVELPPNVIRELLEKALESSTSLEFYGNTITISTAENIECKSLQLKIQTLRTLIVECFTNTVAKHLLLSILNDTEKKTIRNLLPDNSQIARKIKERLN